MRFGLFLALLVGTALSVAVAEGDNNGEARNNGVEEANDGIQVESAESDEKEERGPLRIASDNQKPLPRGQVDLEYRYTFIGEGGTPPYRWRLSEAGDPLPVGMFLDPETGRLEGEPEEEGLYEITVELVDADGISREKTFELHIRGDPFTLRELEPTSFDGRVDREEYSDTAPFRFGLGDDGECTVYIRQSGGTLTFGMVVGQIFLVQNRVRILLAKDEEPIQRVYALEYDPYNAGYDTYRHLVQLRSNPFDDSPSWQPRPHGGWLGRAHTLFADRWHCEIRVNLSEIGMMPGTSAGNLLVSFEVVGPDPDLGAAVAPPRDRYDAYGNRSNFITLRSEDDWGERNDEVLISSRQVRRAREREEAVDRILGDAIQRMEALQREMHNTARRIERYREEHGDVEIDEMTRRHVEELVDEYLESQDEFVKGVEELLAVDSNYYPYMYNIARDFAAQARGPLPGLEREKMWRQALHFAERTRRHNRNFLPARMLVAQASHRLGRYEEALSQYRQMRYEYPRDIALALEVGRMHVLIQGQMRRELYALEAELHELRDDVERFETRVAELEADEEAEEEDLRLAEAALERLRERVEPLQTRIAEQRDDIRQRNHKALAVLDEVAAEHRDDGRVTLACATLLYNLDERDTAERYLAMTLNRVLNTVQLDLAIELVKFLGRHGDFDRMREMAERLAEEEYGEFGTFYYAVSQEFKFHHKYEDALLYASKAVEHMPEVGSGDPASEEATLRLRNMIAIDLLVALGNAERWNDAAEYARRVIQDLHEITEDPREGERDTELSARQLWNRHRELEFYRHYAEQEREARAEDEALQGTERENPRMTLRFYERDGEEFGEVEIELFRNDAGDLVRHLEEAVAEGWYEADEERHLYGGMIQSVRRAHQLTVGPSGPGTSEAPSARVISTGRRHFRGSVSLRTSDNYAGLALQINTATTPWQNELDFPVIGRVVSGMDIIDRIYSDRLRVEVTWQN